MSSGISDFQRNRVLDFVLRGQAFPASTPQYLALFTTIPTAAAAGTEIVYTGYARQLIGVTKGSTGTAVYMANLAAHRFPLAGDTLAIVSAVGLFDALTAGNFLWWADISPTIAMEGTSPGFKPAVPVQGLQYFLDYVA